MTNESKWMLSKLEKMEVIHRMSLDVRRYYEKMGLFETLQIKSVNMYGHNDTIGVQIIYNKAGLFGWTGGRKLKEFLLLKNPMD